MVDDQRQRRREQYFKLSSQIAQIDNARLRSLFDKSETQSSYGTNHVIEVGRSKVFVKRVPVTDLEYDNMFSTRNLYDLPTYYNYGLNSAGLGVFRELVTHIKTTNWVLGGMIAAFPLLYHYRITPFAGVRAEVDKERLADYVTYWGGNANVGRYRLDRACANYELVLFLEYFPDTLGPWLRANPSKTARVLDDMRATITFLRKNGIIHLDAHFNNMLTDGKRVYLTDFGLVLDRHFELSPAEQQFYKQNSYYDYGELLWSLMIPLAWMHRDLSEADKARLAERYGSSAGVENEDALSILLNNVDDLVSSGIMNVNREYAACLSKYRSIITLMQEFYSTMRRNNAKDTRFDHARLRRLLKEAGFVPGRVSDG